MQECVEVGISTLHGNIINLRVDPNIAVSAFKQQCMDASLFHLTPLAINVDLAFLMKLRYSKPADSQRSMWDGVRVALVDAQILDDRQSLGSQVALEDGGFLFKLVFVKQYHMDHDDMVFLHSLIAENKTRVAVNAPKYGTPFVAMPVLGGEARARVVVGLFYQHKETEYHCNLKLRGVDPRGVSHASIFDFLINPRED